MLSQQNANIGKEVFPCCYFPKSHGLPFERKFIKKIRDEGVIEIVLPWTDEGYGIVVKTTGRTINETEKISRIITEKYGGLP